MSAKLTLLSGDNVGNVVGFQTKLVIGNSPDSNLKLPEIPEGIAVASIEYSDGKYFVRILNASVPCKINECDVDEKSFLTHGDIIKVGDCEMLFSVERTTSTDILTKVPTTPDAEAIMENVLPQFESRDMSTLISNDTIKQHLDTLFAVASIASKSLDFEKISPELFQTMVNVLKPDRLLMMLYDAGGRLRIAYRYIDKKCTVREYDLIPRTVLQYVVDKREAVLVRRDIRDERFSSSMTIIKQNVQSALCAPLLSAGKTLGIIYSDRITSSRPYSNNELNLLSAVASQLSIALENFQNYSRISKMSECLQRLGESMQGLIQNQDVEAICRATVETVIRAFDCSRCSVLLFNEQDGNLEVMFSSGIPHELWKSIKIRPGEGACGEVFVTGVPKLVKSIEKTTGADKKTNYRGSSYLIVPIKASGRFRSEESIIGVLTATDKSGDKPFEEYEKDLLYTFATTIGTMMENARLFQKATTDLLTGLYTRHFFFVLLSQMMKNREAIENNLFMSFIDMDNFKTVNDSFGHQIGDEVLRQLALSVKSVIQKVDGAFAARYGGDEFLIVFPGIHQDKVSELLNMLQKSFAAKAEGVVGKSVPLTLSIGVSRARYREGVEELVKRADNAMYKAKMEGKNRIVFSSDI